MGKIKNFKDVKPSSKIRSINVYDDAVIDIDKIDDIYHGFEELDYYSPRELREMILNLTPKQKKWVEEYAKDFNAKRAAIEAGYAETSAGSGCYGLKEDICCKAYLRQILRQQSQKADISPERVLKELTSIAYSNITEFLDVETNKYYLRDEEGNIIKDFNDKPIEVKNQTVLITNPDDLPKFKTASIKSIKQTKNGIEIQLHSKEKGLELLMRHLGMYKTINEHSGEGGGAIQFADVSNLTEEQRKELILRAAARHQEDEDEDEDDYDYDEGE